MDFLQILCIIKHKNFADVQNDKVELTVGKVSQSSVSPEFRMRFMTWIYFKSCVSIALFC